MNITLPTSWKAVSQNQLINIAELLLADEVDLLKVFWALTNLKWYKPKDWVALYRLTQAPANELKPHVLWVLNDKDWLRTWKIKKYANCFGPDEHLNQLTWLEFTVADSIFCSYWQNKSDDFLHALTLALFRPQGQGAAYDAASADFCGDARRPFNPRISEHQRKRISKWPQKVHQAVLLNYIGIRRSVEKEFAHVFSSSNSTDNGGLKGWEPVTISVAGQKFGALKDVEKTPFKKVLRSLEMNAIELEKLKEKHGNN